jgi:hypothetical protein
MKKMFTAIMMDHSSMADHNDPEIIVAEDCASIEAKVRAYIVENYWNRNMPNDKESLTDEEVYAADMDVLEEAFEGECYDEGYSWSIQEKKM